MSAQITEFNPSEFKVGDVVEFIAEDLGPRAPKGPHKIAKINPKSVTVVNPTGLSIRTDRWLLAPCDAEFVESKPMTLGTVVRFRKPTADRMKGAFVILKANTNGTFAIAQLNGNDGRHFKSIPAEQIRVVTAEAGWE